jgi:hypothetical protein
MILKGAEIGCVKILAKSYENGQRAFNYQSDWESIGLTEENFSPVLLMLEHYGIISDAIKDFDIEFRAFQITPLAVQIARDIEDQEKKKEEPKDIVEGVTQMARKNRTLATVIIFGLVLTAALTAVNQFLSILKNSRNVRMLASIFGGWPPPDSSRTAPTRLPAKPPPSPGIRPGLWRGPIYGSTSLLWIPMCYFTSSQFRAPAYLGVGDRLIRKILLEINATPTQQIMPKIQYHKCPVISPSKESPTAAMTHTTRAPISSNFD